MYKDDDREHEIECERDGHLELTFRHGRVILFFGDGGKVFVQCLQEEVHLVVTECKSVRKEV
jgi:hypothetical protein